MLFDDFDQIRIVSLPERADRRRFMTRQLERMGRALGPRVRFFDAIRTDDAGWFRKAGSHGCFLSHLAILRAAAANNESVLILQDDCEFLPSIVEYRMPPCDIFYGGYSISAEGAFAGEVVGAHFMGFSAATAQLAAAYLEDYLSQDFPPDELASRVPGFDPAIRPPIDGAFVWFRRAYPNLTSEFALLSRQLSSRSDISPKTADRLPVARSVLAAIRRVRRAADTFRTGRGR